MVKPNKSALERRGRPSRADVYERLRVQIQELRDEVKIVDAPVEARGGAPDALLACAQATLRGKRFPVAGAKAGQRIRMRYMVTQ